MNNRGISIVGAVFTLLILAIFGVSILSIVSTDQEMRMRQIEKEQAFYDVQAGLEYALREINYGGYPIVANKSLGRGAFTTTIDPTQHIVTSTGVSGGVTKTHQITYSTLGGDCLTINNDQVVLVGPGKTDLKALTLKKDCLSAITIDKMQLVWSPNNGEKVTKIEISNTTVYDNPGGSPSGGIIDISDYMLSGPNAEQISLIRFTSNMLNKDLTITFYLRDTSSRSIAFTILPPNQN